MSNEKRTEPQIRVVERAVTVIQRTIEVTPEVVLSLLRRCKEVPRRADSAFSIGAGKDGSLLSISWEEQTVVQDGREEHVPTSSPDDVATRETEELDAALAEAEEAVEKLS